MHLSTNLEYPWILQLTEEELTVLQTVLRGDSLTADEEDRADKLSETLDMIREKAERSRRRHKPRRGGSRRPRRKDDRELLMEVIEENESDE